MDKFVIAQMLKKSEPVKKVGFIEELCRNKDVLDLGCIRHSAEVALSDPNWLHQKIKTVAKTVVGIDYLQNEIVKMNAVGYTIKFADVTKPFFIGEQFDVIVIGALIEHLSNIDALFDNCKKHLNPNGKIIISTANPFYADEFLYISWKRNYLMNPEHTCWIDPYAMAQLIERQGFEISEMHFIKDSWSLPNIITESEQHQMDIMNNQWTGETKYQEIYRHIIGKLFWGFYLGFKVMFSFNTKLVKHSDYLIVIKQNRE